MEDLLSYRLSDLLLFSEQTYLRQFELYNRLLFPFQYLTFIIGLIMLPALVKQGRPVLIRSVLLLIAACWLWVAYAFIWNLYGNINWMARYLVVVFILQAVLLGCAARNNKQTFDPPGIHITSYTGILLWFAALFAFPLIELLNGRSWQQLSAFALTPDSLATLNISLMLIFRLPWYSFVPATIWLLFSSLTYLAMHSMEVVTPSIALLLALEYSVYFLLIQSDGKENSR
jgi:hypothetical protein